MLLPDSAFTNTLIKKTQSITKHKGGRLPSVSFDTLDSENGPMKTIPENDNDEKLFWFSYDEDIANFPNNIRVEKMKFTITENSILEKVNRADSIFSFQRPRVLSKVGEVKEKCSDTESEEESEKI